MIKSWKDCTKKKKKLTDEDLKKMSKEEVMDDIIASFEEAEEYTRRCEEEAEKALTLKNPQKAAEYYRHIGRYDKVEEILLKIEDINGIIEIYELDKEDELLEKFLIRITDVGRLVDFYERREQFGKLGLIYFKKKDYLKAAENFEKVLGKEKYAEKCYNLFGDEKKLADYLERREEKRKFMRIGPKWFSRRCTPLERNLRVAMAELKRVASWINIPPKVRDEAARMYTFVIIRRLAGERCMETVVAACIYSACEIGNFEVSKEKICETSAVSPQELEDAVNLLKKNKIGYK